MSDSNGPRVPVVTERNQLPPDQRHNYDRIADPRGHVSGPFPVLLNSPEVGGRVGHLGAYVRFESGLSGTVRELAILTTARAFDCAYEWAYHEPLARDEGVSGDAIEVVASRESTDGLSEPASLVVRYGRELFREHEVSEAVFRAAEERFGVRGVTELTATMGYYAMLACVINAFEVLPEDDTPIES